MQKQTGEAALRFVDIEDVIRRRFDRLVGSQADELDDGAEDGDLTEGRRARRAAAGKRRHEREAGIAPGRTERAPGRRRREDAGEAATGGPEEAAGRPGRSKGSRKPGRTEPVARTAAADDNEAGAPRWKQLQPGETERPASSGSGRRPRDTAPRGAGPRDEAAPRKAPRLAAPPAPAPRTGRPRAGDLEPVDPFAFDGDLDGAAPAASFTTAAETDPIAALADDRSAETTNESGPSVVEAGAQAPAEAEPKRSNGRRRGRRQGRGRPEATSPEQSNPEPASPEVTAFFELKPSEQPVGEPARAEAAEAPAAPAPAAPAPAAPAPAAPTPVADEVDPASLPEGFLELGLPQPLLRALADMGFDAPTPIQTRTIPPGIEGRDVVGQAKTGTGKTAAFALPVLANTTAGEGTRTLILTPTRELAVQVREQVELLGRYTPHRSALIYGGVPFDSQKRALAQGVEIIVGTPGRVLDLYRQGLLKLAEIRTVVLDECDRMFDLGFRPDIYRILKATDPARKQLCLFSATVGDEVLKLADKFTKDPEVIYTAAEKLTVEEVDQYYCTVARNRKLTLISELIKREEAAGGLTQAIIFSRTKRGCERLEKELNRRGLKTHAIHGDLNQRQRESVLGQFREKKIKLLVATDVAARGLDINDVSHVFNYDIPEYAEDYVHRIGRTARMGKRGKAFTLVAYDQGGFLTEIEKLTNVMIEEHIVEGVDPGEPDEPLPPRPTGTGKILFSSMHG